jgi:hypothetical protein
MRRKLDRRVACRRYRLMSKVYLHLHNALVHGGQTIAYPNSVAP